MTSRRTGFFDSASGLDMPAAGGGANALLSGPW